jgi:peptidyl-dipeptidase Dcp
VDNPFFDESPLYLKLPPFDRIGDADFAPAFERGMAEQQAEIEAIAAQEDPPTLENTLVAIERSGQTLQRVSAVFFSLTSAHTNDTLEAIRSEVAPRLSAHRDRMLLNGPLFERVKALYDRRDELGLDAESHRLVERYHNDFVRAGAKLSDADKERLKALNAELAALQTSFSQNVLKEVNDLAVVVENRTALAGLSEPAIAAAAEEARSRGLEGRYVLALTNTSGQPLLALLEDRALRERIHKASLSRGSRGGPYDNRKILADVVRLRAERAQLLGYPDHAAYSLENQTAKTTEAVNERLAALAAPAVANARREAEAMQALIEAEGHDFELAAWDWAYYAEKVRSARYDFDESQLRPYFELDNVLFNGVFYAANRLFGLTFEERTDLPV